MRRAALLPAAACLVLSACAGGDARPLVIPKPVPCVKGDLPDEPAEVNGTLTGNERTDIGLIAGAEREVRAWGRGLRGMLEACGGD